MANWSKKNEELQKSVTQCAREVCTENYCLLEKQKYARRTQYKTKLNSDYQYT